MAPKFGTSGLRGLVVDLTPALVADHVRAFVAACPMGTGLWVGRDLRPSSPGIAECVIATARAEGLAVTDCADLPTPALALAAMSAGAAAIMVTGSHIPADRNGLKFYRPTGEITKDDEAAILAALGRKPAQGGRGPLALAPDCREAWVRRIVSVLPGDALAGMTIGHWAHSAVARDLLPAALHALGAQVIDLGRTDDFLAVDTEAVPDWARRDIAQWTLQHGLDALVSTDGDGDRPLLSDETGTVIPGDILGQITAQFVGADTVATPVTSNESVEASGHFARVLRSRIGSPYVIAAMAEAGGKVVGYEANGGFLLGFDADLPLGRLARLDTRDSLLPLIATLAASRRFGSVGALVAAHRHRFTATTHLQGVPTATCQALIAALTDDAGQRGVMLAALGETEKAISNADGLCISVRSGKRVHLRPSGNAPELRLYVQAESEDAAQTLLQALRAWAKDALAIPPA